MTTKIETLKNDVQTDFQLSNFYECSYDDGGESVHLIQNQSFAVYNFDEIAEEWVSKPQFKGCSLPCSPDSLYITEDNRIFLIEFKNQIFKNVNKIQVRTKLYEFIVMTKQLYNFDDTEIKKINYILVHKDESNPRTHIGKRGRCPRDLAILKKHFLINVEVYEASIFNTQYSSILR